MLFLRHALVAVAALTSVIASPILQDRSYETVDEDGQHYNVFEHRATGTKMSYVNNSG